MDALSSKMRGALAHEHVGLFAVCYCGGDGPGADKPVDVRGCLATGLEYVVGIREGAVLGAAKSGLHPWTAVHEGGARHAPGAAGWYGGMVRLARMRGC